MRIAGILGGAPLAGVGVDYVQVVGYMVLACVIRYRLSCCFGMVAAISAIVESNLLIQPVDLGRK